MEGCIAKLGLGFRVQGSEGVSIHSGTHSLDYYVPDTLPHCKGSPERGP